MDARDLARIDFWTVDEARRVLRARRRGESLAAFAKRMGTSASRVSYWSRKLRVASPPRAPRPTRTARPPSRAIELIPVTVVPPRPAVISIGLRNGRVVRVEGDVDEVVLERVIVVAERAGC